MRLGEMHLENKKPIYLFMHLPKTAGTSMRNLLERNYERVMDPTDRVATELL